ncbi:MAG: hypothetical protein LBV80_09870 [Deltaproteobacteria bacterium]|jgi:hypothetical protein|nr:hypothetical protein [Deltaproteobacteria bacterium]
MSSHHAEIYKDSNRMTMEYGKSAIQSAFLLNVAAAVVLLAKIQPEFVFSAVVFASGAACAVLCMGFSYLLRLAITETWRQEGPLYFFCLGPKRFSLTYGQIEEVRAVAIAFWFASLLFFFVGTYKTWQVAKSLLLAD